MEFLVLVAAIIVVGTGIFYGGKSGGSSRPEVLNSSVEQVEISITPTPTLDPTPTVIPSDTPTLNPTNSLTPTPQE